MLDHVASPQCPSYCFPNIFRGAERPPQCQQSSAPTIMCYNGHQLSQVLQLQEAAHHLHSVLPAPSTPVCRACYSRSRHFRVMETDISLHSSYPFSDSILACRGGPVCFSSLHPSSCLTALKRSLGNGFPSKASKLPARGQ